MKVRVEIECSGNGSTTIKAEGRGLLPRRVTEAVQSVIKAAHAVCHVEKIDKGRSCGADH